MTTPTPPVPADADAAFGECWEKCGHVVSSVGSRDGMARIVWHAAVEWASRQTREWAANELRTKLRYQSDMTPTCDLHRLADRLAPGLPGGTEGK